MEYVADLETIETLFVSGIRDDDKHIIPGPRREIFVDEVFHNYRSLLDVHTQLLENLQARQLEQHPNFGMISDLLLDAALNWRDAYMEYVTHYPVAKARVQEEQTHNKPLQDFLTVRGCFANRNATSHVAGMPKEPSQQPPGHLPLPQPPYPPAFAIQFIARRYTQDVERDWTRNSPGYRDDPSGHGADR